MYQNIDIQINAAEIPQIPLHAVVHNMDKSVNLWKIFPSAIFNVQPNDL